MIEQFKQHILKTGLVKKGEKLLLGVSGGPDSVCMLYFFTAIAKELRLNLTAVHFNHSLRDEADAEEEFVGELCRAKGIRYSSEKKAVKDFFHGDSLEQTARQLRYDFFLRCAREYKTKKIALAHHKDDLAETVLMRVIRGAGLKGLRAILPKTKYKNLTVVRPLLVFGKADIVNWLHTGNIAYCVDKSNFEEEFLRNRLRLSVMPMLRELNPAITDGLCNLAQAAGRDYDYIASQAKVLFKEALLKETHQQVELKLEAMVHAHPALFNHLVLLAIEKVKGNTRSIENCHVDEINDMVYHRPLGSVVDIPSVVVRKIEHRLIFQKKSGPYAY